MNRFWHKIIIVVFLGAPLAGLQAQLMCVGAACSGLPATSAELDLIFSSIETQYLNEVLTDMSDAAIIAGTQLSPSGVVNLREFTFGNQVVAGATEQRKLDIAVPGYGMIEDMPSVGMAIVPRLFVGFNVGYLFSGEPHNWPELSTFSLHRFDLYLSGMNSSLSNMKDFAKPKKNEDYDGQAKAMGAELRYHLVEGGDRDSLFFAFTGVSLGIGYNRVEQQLTYSRKNSKLKLKAGSGTTIFWDGEEKITFNSKMDVIPLSIRTGFQFLYLFRFSIGAGVVWGKGNSDLELRRFGRAYASNDYAALLGISLPDSYLDMRLHGKGGPTNPSQSFLTAGIEINIPFVKVFVDATANEHLYSGSVGIRMVF